MEFHHSQISGLALPLSLRENDDTNGTRLEIDSILERDGNAIPNLNFD